MRVLYTSEEFLEAYYAWSRGVPCSRDAAWNKYCDIRDNVPLGTTENRRPVSHTELEIERRRSFRKWIT